VLASGPDVQSLVRTVGQLAGTENLIEVQNDAVRLEAFAEPTVARANRPSHYRDDQHRRALASRGGQRS